MEPIEKKNAEDIGKWLLGLIFSAGIATLQNWKTKRDQAKAYKSQIQEIHDIVRAQPPASPAPETSDQENPSDAPVIATEDLRTIVTRIQQQLTEHQGRGDERHEANIARFEAIEKSQERVGDDISDLRKYLRHNRGETRTMMKKILVKVSELGDHSPKAKDLP